MESYEVLKNATSNVGVKSVAADMNLSSSLVYKWCQPHLSSGDGGAQNPLDRVLKVCELTGDISPIKWLCQQVDGLYVANPPADEPEDLAPVMTVIQNMLKEFSELLLAVSSSYEGDGRITRVEADRIRAEWEDVKSLLESFTRACERGQYR